MHSISVTQFKAKCLKLVENPPSDGLVILKHGKAIAVVYPFAKKKQSLIGAMKGKIKIKGNILSTGLKWDAES